MRAFDPKIAIVGCGALGSYYGAKLCRDGYAVHFLLRSDYEAVRRHGVRVISPEGDFHVNPKAAQTPEEIGPCDLVIVGLKTTANHQFQRLINPLVGPHTMILTLQNGLGNEEKLADLFGKERIMGGLCFVCLNRLEPGKIHALEGGNILMGELKGWPEPRTHDVASMFRHAGVPCKVTDNLAYAHWEKLVWNIPFNGLGVASAAGYKAVSCGDPAAIAIGPCLNTAELLADPRWEALVRALMLEVIAVGDALSLFIPAEFAEKQISRTCAMPPYRASTLIDFERGSALELDALFFEPLRQARAVGVATPQLENLCSVLQSLDATRESTNGSAN